MCHVRTSSTPTGVYVVAVLLLGGFIVWLCAQMAIDPQKQTYLLTIGGGIALGVLALVAGAWRPKRVRRPRAAAAVQRPGRARRSVPTPG